MCSCSQQVEDLSLDANQHPRSRLLPIPRCFDIWSPTWTLTRARFLKAPLCKTLGERSLKRSLRLPAAKEPKASLMALARRSSPHGALAQPYEKQHFSHPESILEEFLKNFRITCRILALFCDLLLGINATYSVPTLFQEA